MPLFSRSLLICHLLVVTLLTSVFSMATGNDFSYGKNSDGSRYLVKSAPAVLDCQHLKGSAARQKCLQAWYDVIKTADSHSQTNQQCQRTINPLTLFPATVAIQLNEIQISSLAPIREEKLDKPHSFTELIYRPPIA